MRAVEALEQQFDAAAGGLGRDQPRLDHTGVVEDEKVTARDPLRQIGEREIGELRAIDVQQTTARALACGRLRDQLARQVVVEVGETEAGHGWTTPSESRATVPGTGGEPKMLQHVAERESARWQSVNFRMEARASRV